ncbi:MAG: putative terminase large subunit [Prokaryotic dsDNA virus sp.]|nr:MAG: putative terminase large subunit [Prokaryotic dsDNA virus sp.]|tara:strand:+ start:20818 stop:22134 length:1317 start_codon:yes stop_codon:yes gene_type:complete
MALIIDTKFTYTQKKAIVYLFDNRTTEVLFGGAAGGGKSWVGCAWLILMCMKRPNVRYLMGRSKLDSLKKTTLNTFFEVCQQWKIEANVHYNFNASSNIIKFYNGSEIMLKDLFLYPSDRNFDSLGSLEITGAFIDEANQITEKAKNIVASRIRYRLDENNLIPKMLMTCNPAKNWTYTQYYRPAKEGKQKPYRQFIQSLVDDNEYISSFYKKQLQTLDELSKQRLLFGNWEYDASNDALIDYDAIINLFNQQGIKGEKYISCDVARFGSDRTVILYWEGLTIKKIQTLLKSAINDVVDKVRQIQQNNQVPLRNIIIDEDGVGGGAKDYLRCTGFVNNARPLKSENYQNLKTQCYYKLSDLINKAQIGIECKEINVKNDIIEELEQVRTKDADKDNKLQIIPKDTIKDIIGRSPDYADAIAMRMYYEIDGNYGKYFIQ